MKEYSELVHLFLGQEQLHVLRALEPALKYRHHARECVNMEAEEVQRCEGSRRMALGSKAQLARAFLGEGNN